MKKLKKGKLQARVYFDEKMMLCADLFFSDFGTVEKNVELNVEINVELNVEKKLTFSEV